VGSCRYNGYILSVNFPVHSPRHVITPGMSYYPRSLSPLRNSLPIPSLNSQRSPPAQPGSFPPASMTSEPTGLPVFPSDRESLMIRNHPHPNSQYLYTPLSASETNTRKILNRTLSFILPEPHLISIISFFSAFFSNEIIVHKQHFGCREK
jgi:hypothetical protein